MSISGILAIVALVLALMALLGVGGLAGALPLAVICLALALLLPNVLGGRGRRL